MKKHTAAATLAFAAVLFVGTNCTTSEAQGFLRAITGEYGFVAKVEVSDMTTSVLWYTTKLGFMVNNKYTDIQQWRQLFMPGIDPNVQLGLYQPCSGPPCKITTSGGAVSTFVVSNIHEAITELEANGIACEPEWAGEGVCECFFKDPDGNGLGLRQNGTTQPSCTG